MTKQDDKLNKLRTVITENLRTQIGNERISYISAGHTVGDTAAKQSHCIFARRGCGKTLLLHYSRRQLPDDTKAIYINCEDFKHHSFPNVLIEILEFIFKELDRNLLGWFGKSKKLKLLLNELRGSLATLRSSPDAQSFEIKATENNQNETKDVGTLKVGIKEKGAEVSASLGRDKLFKASIDIEKKYTHNESKLQQSSQL